MQKSLPVLLFIIISKFACAQEVWLEPSKFLYANRDSLKVTIKQGLDFISKPWQPSQAGSNETTLMTLTIHGLPGVTKTTIDDSQIAFLPKSDGTYMFVTKTPDSFREMPADEFNTYLKDAALDDAYGQRHKSGSLDKPGKESYAHFVKLLVQVGSKADDSYTRLTKLTIEIIPQQNPYDLKVGDRVQFKILYEGKPLFGARVKVWNRHNNRTSVQNIFTEQNGMIETHISNPGAWMVTVVRMIPSKNPQADWQSFKGSLVFGIK